MPFSWLAKPGLLSRLLSERMFTEKRRKESNRNLRARYQVRIQTWRGRDGNDPAVNIAKDADQRV